MERTLQTGRVMRTFETADGSNPVELVPAIESRQTQIMDGYLWVGGAGKVTIRSNGVDLAIYYPGAAAVIPLDEVRELVSDTNEAIEAVSDTAISLKGDVIYRQAQQLFS